VRFSNKYEGLEQQIVGLFIATFTASEGADEGAVIGNLVSELLSDTPKQDVYAFTADGGGEIIGGAVFSRLIYANDPRCVFILSPMAVAPHRQSKGVGQALLKYALAMLRDDGIDVAITYGDPAFYGKVGFLLLDEATASPLPLSSPHGWIGQSLTDEPLHPLNGDCTCVAALNNPAIW